MFLSKTSRKVEGGDPQVRGLCLGLTPCCKNRIASDLRRVESLARPKERKMQDISPADTQRDCIETC
jgi:hypothetical protein